LHGLGSYGEFFLGQGLILFVRGNCCNCASRGKLCANEFFKLTYEISKSRPYKCILTEAYEHYALNLCSSVNAQLRAQSCRSNQNMGEGSAPCAVSPGTLHCGGIFPVATNLGSAVCGDCKQYLLILNTVILFLAELIRSPVTFFVPTD
jgi:hypothetical protein